MRCVLAARTNSYAPGKMEFKAPPVTDPNLKAFLDKATEAADTFLNAIADMEERLSFKAFTIGGAMTKEQKNAILDILMTQMAIRVKEMAPTIMNEKTITSSVEDGENEMVMWMHATNVKPEAPAAEVPYAHFDPDANEPVAKMTVVTPEEAAKIYEAKKAELAAEMAEVKEEARVGVTRDA